MIIFLDSFHRKSLLRRCLRKPLSDCVRRPIDRQTTGTLLPKERSDCSKWKGAECWRKMPVTINTDIRDQSPVMAGPTAPRDVISIPCNGQLIGIEPLPMTLSDL